MGLLAAVLVATSLLAGVASAAEAPELQRLFPRERAVFVERDGLVRIPVPAEVLAACRPGLSDLRVVDGEGREVPYVVDAGLPPGSEVALVGLRAAEIVEVRREEQRREDGPAIHRETYVLVAPPAGDGPWELVLDARADRFVRTLEIAGEGGEPLLTASVFRLPDLDAETIRVPLPSPLPARLTVTLRGEEGAYLEPRFDFETTRTVAAPRERMTIVLREVGRRRENGRSIIELERPRGVVPDVLELATQTGTFNRRIEVWDEATGRKPVQLARGQVVRVQAPVPIEARTIAVPPARGERLRVEIDDGDSPALEGIAVSAVVRQPVLVLALRGAGEAPAGRLLYGGDRAHAPRYDLAAFLPAARETLADARATAAARLYDPAQTALARVGEPRDNPDYDRTPALAFAMRPSAAVDERAWTHRRPIALHPSPDGLTRVRLTAEDLARARPDLADVRVVDAESRQWPYLLDREHAEGTLVLAVPTPVRRRRASVYELRPPFAPVAVTVLPLGSDVPFFERAAVVTGYRGDGSEVRLAAGRLARRGSGPVTIALRPEAVDRLEVAIEDGNDAPLGFRDARLAVREHDLYVAAPAGRYAILLGSEDAKPPTYELERVRDVVLAVGTGAAESAALVDNPKYSVRARLITGEGLERTVPVVILWVVLIAAVAVLTVVTLRFARRGETG